MGEHTKGPWVIRDHTVGYPPRRAWLDIEAPDKSGRGGHPICRIVTGFTNQDADARLIVAAPDLLMACLAMLWTWGTQDEEAVVRARDMAAKAIDKAIGDPPPA